MESHSGALMTSMDSNNQPAANGPAAKRRRKNDGEPSEPRRLRRSHEACTRCRGKKIKCDSKHPRCTACVTAGVPCNQEDRHRQTTIARDHTERLELLVSQCDALLRRHYQGFNLQTIDDICATEGIDVSNLQPVQSLPQPTSSGNQPAPPMNPAPQPPAAAYLGYYAYPPYMYPPLQVPPLAPTASAHSSPSIPGQDPKSNDMSSTQALAKSFGVAPSIVNDASASQLLYPYPPPPAVFNTPNFPTTPARPAEEDLAVGSSGLDSGRDRVVQLEMPAPRDTAKWRVVSVFRSQNFSADSSVDIWIPNDHTTLLDIVNVYFTLLNPHRPVFFRHQFLELLDQLYDEAATSRPVFDPGFICSLYLVLALGTLSEINRSGYQGEAPGSDGGDVTMDEEDEDEPSYRSRSKTDAARSHRLPPDWPAHDEFFDRALAVKPELRVTLSSLQALILLHWYLYAERQGRTLWRLVGSIVRLAIELGLHHDPTTQMMPNPHLPTSPGTISDVEASYNSSYNDVHTFTPLECTLRIRLWSIVLVHDRGTSILLGRPLAIAPSDSNTPRPSTPRAGDPIFTASPGSNVKPPTMTDLEVSEHFILSAPIEAIQADIIISLYSPTRQSGETLLRNASRIIRSINVFRRSLPPSYKHYFTGTAGWPIAARHKLLAKLTESAGLTLLKLAISRILLLRALFSSKELSYEERRKALIDAIVQAHNVIAIHTVLVRFPQVGFFTSPVPLHIAAMVILYGRMSKCDQGIPGLSDGEGNEDGKNAVRILMEDVWLALDMLPRFRWRWETGTGSSGGTNPLIAKLAEKVMEASFTEDGFRGIGPPDESDQRSSTASTESRESRLIAGIGRQGPVGQPVLIPETEWEDESVSPGREKTTSTTPVTSNGPWEHPWGENASSPKSQHPTPTLQAAAYPTPSSFPPASTGSSGGVSYTYPPPTPTANIAPVVSSSNSYPSHPQYSFGPPVFGPQPPNGTGTEKSTSKAAPAPAISGTATPVTQTRSSMPPSSLSSHMVEVPQSLFYPFYPDTPGGPSSSVSAPHTVQNGLLSPPPSLPRSLLAAVAVHAHAHGGQQGAPDLYMNEERTVQNGHPHPPLVGGFVTLGPGTYHATHPQLQLHPHSHYSVQPPPPSGSQPPETHPHPSGSGAQSPAHPHPPSSHLHHSSVPGPYAGHHINGHAVHGSMPPPLPGVWPPHASPPLRPTGYTAQPSS